MIVRRVIGNLTSQRRIIAILAVAAGLLPASKAVGNEINLITPYPGSGSFATGTTVGGAAAVYSTIDTKPTGTGVFDPFLTYQRKGIEEGINTSLLGNGQGVLDDKRVPQWTHDLKLGQLAEYIPGFYAFELDANETGTGNINRLLSIDDIRIYTSAASPFTTLQNDEKVRAALDGNPADLGDLRYAQNAQAGTTANYVLIDASRSEGGSTSGSGSSDMILLVPTSLFPDRATNPDLFVTFYTLNGAHDAAGEDAAAGFEEWSAFTSVSVPDGSSTLLLLGAALIPLGILRARREMSNKA
jgi:hypothetical protein